jgi:uncharacterized protein (DUF1800 family)
MPPGADRPHDANPWAAYAPGKAAPWDLRRVVHLHRRAGFAATWGEIQRDLADGPAASIDRLLAGKARERVPPGFEPTAAALADAAVYGREPVRLKAWWVYRMLLGPDPLAERLALAWHNHFATSNLKVDHLAAMRRQNELFRERGRGPFGKLLRAVVHDPAMLVWLDAPANHKGHVNENLARELMELFTLGIGPYTETDVKEAARALTGWTVADNRFRAEAARHDDGDKTVLGRRGAWDGDDLLGIVLDHPATADRLAFRVCELFFGENAVGDAGRKALADGLRGHDLDVGWAVETVLRSEAFFAEVNLGSRVAEPAAFVVAAARALELLDPPPSTVALADWAARLGQDLFYPPNVFGWPGGRAWVTPRAAVRRTAFAAALAAGETVGLPGPPDVLGIARRHGRGRNLDDLLAFYVELLLGRPLTPAWRERLVSGLGPRLAADDETARGALALILASPEAQLG